jgi:alpha-tubulin suppressor-like RCC1 family protein
MMKKRTYIVKDNTKKYVRASIACLLLLLVLGASIPAAAPALANGVPVTGGDLFAWGDNYYGQLGDGNSYTHDYSPVQVSNLAGVTAIAAGKQYTLAARSDGSAWAWGFNGYGVLGNGTATDSNLPGQVKDAAGTGYLTSIVAVSAGSGHCLALKSDGTVWAWGDNEDGELGYTTTSYFPGSYLPVQVKDAAGTGNLTNITAIAAGGVHSLAVKSDGTVWAWGAGNLGNGTNGKSFLPVQVSSLTNIVAIAAGTNHSLALTSSGTVWAWGANMYGQLGNGTNDDSYSPVQVLYSITGISAGENHSLALGSNGRVLAWGDNYYGQLGDGTNTESYSPVQVTLGIAAVSAGRYHSLALKTDGTVWAWGYNYKGQLGNGTNTNSNTPVPVRDAAGTGILADGVAISAGYDHSVAITGSVATTSSDATLSSLTISSGTLTPGFASGTLAYSDSVANSVSSVNITPTVNESHATVTVNSQPVISGQASQALNLNVGDNTISIMVTAQDGTTTQAYTVTVTRQSAVPNDATLGSLTISSGTLTPVFASGILAYSDSVANSVSSVNVTPTVNESHATVTVNDQPVISGQPSQALNLNVGDNTISIMVTAQDGTTTQAYTVTVTRQPWQLTYTLTMIAMSGGNTNPAGTHTYPAGTVVPISATAWSHWMFYCWSGDVDSFLRNTTVTMDGDKTVTAHFDAFVNIVIAHSPVELRVYDSQNRVTGLVNGIVKEEIPNSSYNSTNTTVVINPATDSYYYQVAGTGAGTYGLEVKVGYFLVGQTTSFNATDIPILSGAIHQYTIDWDALSQGQPGVTLQIDSNGDGKFERTITAGNELTADEFWPYTFQDSQRGTILRIDDTNQTFQFIAPDKEFPIKKATRMKVIDFSKEKEPPCKYDSHDKKWKLDGKKLDLDNDLKPFAEQHQFNQRPDKIILINYKDGDLQLSAVVVDGKEDSCVAFARDLKTKKTYLLIVKPELKKPKPGKWDWKRK